MEYGKFPWDQLIQSLLPIILAYFTGSYKGQMDQRKKVRKEPTKE